MKQIHEDLQAGHAVLTYEFIDQKNFYHYSLEKHLKNFSKKLYKNSLLLMSLLVFQYI